MQALTLHAPFDLRYEAVPDPLLEEPHEALIRVRSAGLCGSDLHPYRGHEKGCDAGTVMGHEFVGEVVAVGGAVKNFRPGQQVYSAFSTCCGGCDHCTEGLTCRCSAGQLLGWVQNDLGLQGAQAELVKIPFADSTLLEVSSGLSDKSALLLGDNLSTGYYGVLRAGVRAGRRSVVIGCGTVGLMAVLCALELGGEAVTAVDPQPSRRSRASALGAIALSPEEVEDSSFHCVIEAVGNQAAMALGYRLARPGATIASVGVHTSPGFAFSPSQLYDKNLTYRSGRCPARAIAPELVPLALAQKETLEGLFTHSVALSQGPRAYQIFDRGEDGCQKILLTP